MDRNRFYQLLEKRKFRSVGVGYRVVLFPHFEFRTDMSEDEKKIIEELNSPIEFDYVSSSSLSTSSEITEHPLVNGDYVADHMYKKPISLSFSGIFSLNGAKPTKFTYGGKDRLTNIQILFEKIKNEGIFVDIVTENRQNSEENRFIIRKNCVLNEITWNEGQNSLGFSFSFEQVLVVGDRRDEKNENHNDSNLPAITDAFYMSFADEILDINELQTIVFTALKRIGLIDNYFIVTYSEFASKYVHVAESDIVFSIEYGIQERKYRRMLSEFSVKPFRTDKNGQIKEEDKERFTKLVTEIRKQFQAFKDTVQGWKFTTNEQQECMCIIDNAYYIFRCTVNNNTGKYEMRIIDGETQNDIISSIDIEGLALSSYQLCNESNYLFKTTNGFRVYLMLKNQEISLNDIEGLREIPKYPVGSNAQVIANYLTQVALINSYNTLLTEQYIQSQIDEFKKDLRNYYILTTNQDMTQFNDKLSEVIKNYVKK